MLLAWQAMIGVDLLLKELDTTVNLKRTLGKMLVVVDQTKWKTRIQNWIGYYCTTPHIPPHSIRG